MKIFEDIKADTICIASRGKNKNKDIHDTYMGIALRYVFGRARDFVHWFALSTN